jgi:hypothetical protein
VARECRPSLKRKIRGSPIGPSEFEYAVYGLSLETGSPRKFDKSLVSTWLPTQLAYSVGRTDVSGVSVCVTYVPGVQLL